MNREGVHVNFASDPVQFTLINFRKIHFIAYIYNHFNENVVEKSDISTKIEMENMYTQFFC